MAKDGTTQGGKHGPFFRKLLHRADLVLSRFLYWCLKDFDWCFMKTVECSICLMFDTLWQPAGDWRHVRRPSALQLSFTRSWKWLCSPKDGLNCSREKHTAISALWAFVYCFLKWYCSCGYYMHRMTSWQSESNQFHMGQNAAGRKLWAQKQCWEPRHCGWKDQL